MPCPASPRQMQLLRFIHGYQLAHDGVSPSVRECLKPLGLASTGAIVALLDGLEERDAVIRQRFRFRAIEVLQPPAIPMIADQPLYAVPGPWWRT